jgi:hypothetical protein
MEPARKGTRTTSTGLTFEEIADQMVLELFDAAKGYKARYDRAPTPRIMADLLAPIREQACRFLPPEEIVALSEVFAASWKAFLIEVSAARPEKGGA